MKTLSVLSMLNKHFNKIIKIIIERDVKKMIEYKNLEKYTYAMSSYKRKPSFNMHMNVLGMKLENIQNRKYRSSPRPQEMNPQIGIKKIITKNRIKNKKDKLNKQCCNLTKKGIRCKNKCKYMICRRHNSMTREYEEKFHKMHKHCMKKINPISKGILSCQIKFH
jgi:hypothetical protein